MRRRRESAAADDAAVIESSRREPELFAVLFDRHAPHIHRYLARRAGRQIADDLVAETFLAAFAKRDRYDLRYSDARPWLYGIATNLVGQHRRDEVRQYRIGQAATAEPEVPGHAGPLQPAVPAPVLDAVKLMYGGAAGTVAQLIIALAYIGDSKAYHLTVLGHHLTTAQLSHLRPLIITLVIGVALVLVALWLWMARATGQGKSWARIVSTVLFGLATLELTGIHGIAQLFWAMLTWLTGLVAVWLLWRPASTAFFRERRQTLTRAP